MAMKGRGSLSAVSLTLKLKRRDGGAFVGRDVKDWWRSLGFDFH